MANRYWVGGAGKWDATAGTKWATTSGGAGGASVPTTADAVFFDAASGANIVDIGNGYNPSILSLTMTGFTGTLAYGSQNISLSGTGTIYTGATTFSVTGTPVINCTDSSATSRTINPTTTTEANSISFNITAGTGAFSISSLAVVKNLNFTGFTGSLNSLFRTIYGSMTLGAGMTATDGTGTWTFASTLVQQNITSNGVTFGGPITCSGTQTVQLQDALTLNSGRTFTLTSGTLDLNNKTLTTGLFSSSNSNTRSIAFGTGNITLTGSSATIWTTATATNFSYTGTPTVNTTYSGSTGTRTVTNGSTGGTESNAISFNVTAGTDIFTVSSAATQSIKNLNFTGFTGTFTNTVRVIYGNLTVSSGMTCTAGTSATTFASTSGTQQITTNGNATIDFPITQNGVGGTVQLQDALTTGSTRTFTLTNGTLDLNNKTLTCGLFSSSNSNIRSIAFGTGNITVTGSGATIWNLATATNLTITGNSTVNATYSGSTGTRVFTSAQAIGAQISLNVSNGSDTVTTGGVSYFTNINLTGFSGSFSNTTRFINGNLTLSSFATIVGGNATTTFAGTSGTQLITTAGQTIDFPLTFNGLGGTFAFQDALTMGSTRTLTLSAGSLLLKSGTTNTVGNIVLSGNDSSNTRLSATEQQFAAFLQKVVGGTITASNITIENSYVTPENTWFGDSTTIDGGNNTNWTFEQTALRGHDAFLPQEIRHFKDLDRKAKAAEAARIRAVKLMAYHRKRRFKELLAPELINPQEDSFYEQLREEQFPEEVAKERTEKATAEEKAKVEAKKREIKKELKRLKKEEKEAADKVAELQRQKELLIDSVIARQKAVEIQAQLAIIEKLRQEEMEDEQALLLLI